MMELLFQTGQLFANTIETASKQGWSDRDDVVDVCTNCILKLQKAEKTGWSCCDKHSKQHGQELALDLGYCEEQQQKRYFGIRIVSDSVRWCRRVV